MARVLEPSDRGTALFDELLCQVPLPGSELGIGTVPLALRAPVVLAVLAVPLVLDGVACPCLLEVVDRVEVDERKHALRCVRPCLRLEHAPLFEQLGPRSLAEQEPGPHPRDRDRRKRPGRSFRVEHLDRPVGELRGSRRVVSNVEVDELRVDARRERPILGAVSSAASRCSVASLNVPSTHWISPIR